MDSTIIKRRMKPILYPQTFLEKKIQRKWQTKDTRSKFVCLAKYFPKYYKRLELYDDLRNRSIQLKIKQLKIVNEFCCYRVSNHKKTFKKLFQSCRKTLKNVPSFDRNQDLSLCLFFPRLKTIDLQGHRLYSFKRDIIFFNAWITYEDEDTEKFKRFTIHCWKFLKRTYGYFWAGNRFVENLKVVCETDAQLIIIKKLNDLKKFLSPLKTLEFTFYWNNDNGSHIPTWLMKNNNFLQHVTHLKIENFGESGIEWKDLQSFIKCYPQLSFLSFTIPEEDPQSESHQDLGKDLSLDFSCFPKLQVLEINLDSFETLIRRVEFSPSIREVTLATHNWTRKSFEKILNRRVMTEEISQIGEFHEIDDENGEVEVVFEYHGIDYEGEDTKDWEGFEQYKMMGCFIEKWKKLKNLKVLNLSLWNISNMHIMMKMFILPLLRENLQLETFHLTYDSWGEDKIFDLETFFEGIKPLRSLKDFSLTYREDQNPELFFLFRPGKLLFLANLSSLKICAKSLLDFDVFQFFKAVFHNLESQPKNKEKSVKLSRIPLRSVQELIKLINLLDQASQFKNLQIDLEVELFTERFDEKTSNLLSLKHLPENTKLRAYLYDPRPGYWILDMQGAYSSFKKAGFPL